jgi:transposase
LLWNLRRAFPTVKLAWADGGYAGKLVTWAKTQLSLAVEIVKRPDDLHTFQVPPRRWVVERTLSWITRHRRTVRDCERQPAHHETCVYWAMIIVMSRRLAHQHRRTKPSGQPRPPRFSSRLLVFLVALGIDDNIFLMTRVLEESSRSGVARSPAWPPPAASSPRRAWSWRAHSPCSWSGRCW